MFLTWSLRSSRSCAAWSGSPSGLASSLPVAAFEICCASWVRPASFMAAWGSVRRASCSWTDPILARISCRSAPCSRSWRARRRSCSSSASRCGSGVFACCSASLMTSSIRSATLRLALRAASRSRSTTSCGFGHTMRTSSRASAIPPAADGRRARWGRKAERRSEAARRARASASWRASSSAASGSSSCGSAISSRAVPSRSRRARSASAPRAASVSDGRRRHETTAQASSATMATPAISHGAISRATVRAASCTSAIPPIAAAAAKVATRSDRRSQRRRRRARRRTSASRPRRVVIRVARSRSLMGEPPGQRR